MNRWLVTIKTSTNIYRERVLAERVLAERVSMREPRVRELPACWGLGLLLSPAPGWSAPSLSMLPGAGLAAVVGRRGDRAELVVSPVVAGRVAGERLAGVLVTFANMFAG